VTCSLDKEYKFLVFLSLINEINFKTLFIFHFVPSNSSLTMLGGGNSGGGIQNDTSQAPTNNFEDAPQVSNDMDDEIPF
jgi:hypothetical protein